MSVIDQLKKESLKLRKEKNDLASFSVFTISEIEKIGKNDGNRSTTDAEAIQYVKKQIQKSNETLTIVKEDSKKNLILREIQLLETLLPQMVSNETVCEFLETIDISSMNKGQIMGEVKKKFGVLVDMKSVGNILKEKFNV